MNWKPYLIACVSLLSTAVPQNMIGCGPGVDPYDYYIHFFNQHQWDEDYEYEPYYYTGVHFLYTEPNDEDATSPLIEEWKSYFGKNASEADISFFIFNSRLVDVENLYDHVFHKKQLDLDTFFHNNNLTKYFIKSKDREGLNYIRYAKQIEPYVQGSDYNWEAPVRDSVQMSKLIQTGIELHKNSKLDFFKLKYGYQIVRLAHYSDNFANAILYYDQYVAPNKTKSILQHLSLSLKAGALLRVGNNHEAAYCFSKVFNANQVKKKSNYIGFNWSVNSVESKEEYLKYCKNDKERTGMLALFGFNNSSNAQSILNEIYSIDPNAKALEVLVVREINKLEEHYLTPILNKKKGSIDFVFYWDEFSENENYKIELENLTLFLEEAGNNNKIKNIGFYNLSAAYCAMMLKEYARAETLMNKASNLKLNESLQDQFAITSLMLTLNSSSKIDAALEAKILPSLEWLATKIDKLENHHSPYNFWKIVYRNLFSEILAKKYHAQGDKIKEILCVGAADLVHSDYWSLIFFRKAADANLCIQLHKLLSSDRLTPFEKFLKSRNTLDLKVISDFAGTAFIRDQNYTDAIVWLEKDEHANDSIFKNPFIELLYDQENHLPSNTVYTTKLQFAKQMLQLQKASKNDSEAMYQYALGLYNTTYYGYAWELVEYARSGSDECYIPDDATSFLRNYYGAFDAYDYFKKAMLATKSKEMKAKCLFMMAKCAQKQIPRPRYQDYPAYHNYSDAEKVYMSDFYNNKHFPEFVSEYGKTKFFQQAFNSCSYLRDFIKHQAD